MDIEADIQIGNGKEQPKIDFDVFSDQIRKLNLRGFSLYFIADIDLGNGEGATQGFHVNNIYPGIFKKAIDEIKDMIQEDEKAFEEAVLKWKKSKEQS